MQARDAAADALESRSGRAHVRYTGHMTATTADSRSTFSVVVVALRGASPASAVARLPPRAGAQGADVDSTTEILREPVVGEGGEPGEPFPRLDESATLTVYQGGRRLTKLTTLTRFPAQQGAGPSLKSTLTSAEVKLASGKVA
jgi:hypothetical protein